MDKIKIELQKLGIELVYLDTQEPGCFINTSKIFFVSSNLSEEEVIEVIYHEIGHLLLHSDKIANYKNPSRKSCMENDANAYLISRLADDHDGYFNYSEAIEKYHLAIGWELNIGNK